MNNVLTIKTLPSIKPKRVVGYARVSTNDEMQDTSYLLQIAELEKDIKSNPNYQFLGVFKDKGSGTSLKFREEFVLMIELAKKGEIDIIITKSISRFGRNLTEAISVIRELKNVGVEVIFQKENISSLDEKLEFLFSMLAAHAEEESNNISQNRLWGIAKAKRNGDNLTSRLYGYKIINNKYHIVESEAKVIRKIFEMYISGSTYKEIIAHLYDNDIKTFTGNKMWSKRTLENILRNEKYCGDMILGKHFNHFSKRFTNHGEHTDMVIVKNNHEGIISKDDFSKAIKIRVNRRTTEPYNGGRPHSPYAGLVYSSLNERCLRFCIERPKGKSGRVKSEIPTLVSIGVIPGSKRVSIRVEVIMVLLNQVLRELKTTFRSKTLPIYKLLNDNYLSILSASKGSISTNLLTQKMRYEKMISNYDYIEKTVRDNKHLDIDTARKVFRKIIINKNSSISIKISLTDDKTISLDGYDLVHKTWFTYIKLQRSITIPIFIYFEGVRVIST